MNKREMCKGLRWIDFTTLVSDWLVGRIYPNSVLRIQHQSNRIGNKSACKMYNALNFQYAHFLWLFLALRSLLNHVARYFQVTFVALISQLLYHSEQRVESSGEWDKKRNKREANHHCGDLLAAIRNHSSFGQVCAVNDSDTWITARRKIRVTRKRMNLFYWFDCISFG